MTPRRFPLTDLPWPLMLTLVAIGLPRTVLADLDVVAPESSALYYVLALGPFVVWLAVAVLRPSRRPVRNFLVLGLLYGLSLVLVHQLLWTAPGSQHSIPRAALDLASGFQPGLRELVVRLCSAVVGLGTGAVTAVVAVVAGVARGGRSRQPWRVGR
ncbi:hypothetical protein GC722_01090 [Auraticoccus sp. F435]|uniref:Uncharacterized protein n=1 Tax=Auraticoccus cholistanensis TaxID=2656650 RepID=A0A6A9UQ16_9ACTN|nr:hypothetical protein [Auraticoccus cholistanensis]MVA74638.1 hypothetical protein [Auraticoccus cholistanensis]